MPKKGGALKIEDLLIREIDKAPSLRSVAQATGLRYGNLWRFYHEGSDIRLSSVQALLDHFGYKVIKKPKRR